MPRATRLSVSSRLMFWPWNDTVPSATGTSPMIADSMLVLPAPLGPSSVTISPSLTESETECTARTAP